ncbi:MAG: ATP-dependent Clp protease adaptor ClpS [Phycisphaerales bacterium]|nr:ATP-dependent Clp protease adaptor ClpS [Phycisphaerales bacterium]
MTEATVMEQKTAATPAGRHREKVKRLPPYNVVLLDDDEHTYEYVIEMLQAVFGYPRGKGWQMAREVDTTGRAIVFTGHRELAELKRQQIQAYGADFRISSCRGSMRATIEPAEL